MHPPLHLPCMKTSMTTPVPVKTVLIADPCEALCELLQFALVTVGFHVLTATTADEAIQIAHDIPSVDLLLVDSEISEMRSDHLAAYISTLHQSASVILTADRLDEFETAMPVEFLPKPFTADELRRTVCRALASRPARAEMALPA